jgi:hypothetical protein
MFAVKTNLLITWEHFHRDKFGLRSNKSETYLISWPDLLWNFGLRSLTQNIHPESTLQELAYHQDVALDHDHSYGPIWPFVRCLCNG